MLRIKVVALVIFFPMSVIPNYSSNFFKFVELLQFAATVNLEESYEQPETIADSRIKSRICENVLTSGVFQISDMEHVNLLKPFSVLHLKTSYMDFAQQLRTEEGMKLRKSFPFQNTKRTIRFKDTGEEVVDHAFVCVGRLRGSTHTAYYISDEYNVNLISQKHVAGRFVFVKDSPFTQKMRVAFLAREPASVIEDSPDELEKRYTESRRKGKQVSVIEDIPEEGPVTKSRRKEEHIAVQNSEEKPACKLGRMQRIQLCSSIMNAKFFDCKLEYLERETADCVFKRVRLKNQNTEDTENNSGTVTTSTTTNTRATSGMELMVRCLTEESKKVSGTHRYVFQGEGEENFFVCYLKNPEDTTLCDLETLSENVIMSTLRYSMSNDENIKSSEPTKSEI